MANENEILKRVCEQTGLGMTRSSDFVSLAQAIYDKTKENLGVNTLKRLFGFKTQKVAPRVSTLDIIARFLGFSDYKSLLTEIGEEADISMFSPIEGIEIETLNVGSKVRIAYEPRREFYLTYMGESRFHVDDVEGSRNILKDDIMVIHQLALGHRLIATHVYRSGQDLGAYESAKSEGLQSIELLTEG